MKKEIKGRLFLFLAALIWGTAFAAQSAGMKYVGPFTFNGIRTLVGAASIAVYILIRDRIAGKNIAKTAKTSEDKRRERRVLLIGGLVTGLFLTVAGNLQQIGIQYTQVGKAGFITALYMVLVPIIGIPLGRKAGLKVWISILLASVGLYLLCITGTLTIGSGDLIVLVGSIFYALQVISVDHFAPQVDPVKLSCVQMIVSGTLSCIMMFIMETPTVSSVLQAALPILYVGVFSSGIAYTFQMLGQVDTPPAQASLIMSLESVISVLAGWVFLHEYLSARQLIGCGIMFGATLLAQLPERQTEEDKKTIGEQQIDG